MKPVDFSVDVGMNYVAFGMKLQARNDGVNTLERHIGAHQARSVSMPAPKSDLVKRLVKLRKEREAAQIKADKLKAQMDELEPQVLGWFSENGFDSIRVNGVTVYIRRELWASVGDQGLDFLRDALDAAEIDPDTIIAERANTQTLSALIREFDRDERPLPNSLAAAVKVSEKFRLGFRAS